MAAVNLLSSSSRWSKILLLPLVLLFCKMNGQSGTVVCGGDVSNSSGSASISVGATFYSYFSDNQFSVTQGLQQSYTDCEEVIDSVQLINLAQGVYRVHLNNPLPSASDYTVEWKPDTASVWRSRSFTKAYQPYVNLNITPWFNNTIAVRIAVNNGSSTTYGCMEQFATPCKPMVLQTVEQRAATCTSDSALVRVGYSGGAGVKSILWSNGATTKRTYADQGETLTVTVTDAAGCSMSSSITASTLDNTAVPLNWTLTKGGPTIFNGSFTAPSLPAGATLIGYRMAYRLRGTQTWTNTPLSQNTTISVDFTGSGLPGGNYEFVAFTRYRLNGVATNSIFTCRIAKGYNGVGNKSEGSGQGWAEDSKVSVYPNPTEALLHVQAPLSSELVLMDMQGKSIVRHTSTAEETSLDLSSFAQGVYLLHVQTPSGGFSQRVVKR